MAGHRGRAGLAGAVVAGAVAIAAIPAQARQDAYVASYNDPSVAVAGYNVAPGGALTTIAGSPFGPGGGGTETVASTADGRFVYATEGSGTVIGYGRAGDGTLTAIPGSPFSRGSGAYGLTTTPDGRYLYATNSSSISVFAIGADGALSALATVSQPTGAVSVVVSPDGRHLYSTDAGDRMYGYDIGADGGLTLVPGAPLSGIGATYSFGFTPDGRRIYIGDRTSDVVRTAAVADDGSLSLVGSPVATGDNPFGVGVSPDGRFLFTANYNSGEVRSYTLSATGDPVPAPGSPVSVGLPAAGLTTNAAGTRLFVDLYGGGVLVYAIGDDGALTPIPGSPFSSPVSGDLQPIALTPAQPPRASFSQSGSQFDASASTDPDGSIATYRWDFGDGTVLADGGARPTHAYARPGTYTVRLTLTDDDGCSTRLVSTGPTAYCNGSGAATTTRTVVVPAPGVAPRDTVAPVITKAALSQKVFAVDAHASASAAAVRRGTRIGLTLSEPATVVFVTEQRVRGRWRKVRIFGKRLPDGRSSVRFSGRIKPRGKSRSLKPGRYRIRMRPSDRAGNRGTVTTIGFRIASTRR